MLPTSYDNLDVFAAGAYAKSRDCAIAISHDVLHHLQPLDRTGPERLLGAIEHRAIFDATFLAGIDELLGKIEQMIVAGTTVDRRDTDVRNVTAPSVWTEQRRSRQAEELGRALMFLVDLHETLLAVHDLLHAERALVQLRQAA